MTDKKALGLLLLESECVKNRLSCNKDCKNCTFHDGRALDIFDALRYAIKLLKARNPELYFADNIQHLQEVLSNETQGKEIR